MNNEMINSLKENFESRNIELEFFHNRESLIDYIKSEVSSCDTVGIGNSQTLKHLGISGFVSSLGKKVLDKTEVTDQDEIRRIKKQALLTDCYISSCNALSCDGKIVNIDHSGNRVAAITYGPDKVLIVVGTNKLEKTEQDALKRAMAIATPKNATRAKIESPCSTGGTCSDCTQDVRVCNYVSVIRGQHRKGRMKVLLLDEVLGF